MTDVNTFLLTEKYRPQSVEDCILPPRIKEKIALFVKEGQIPHMLFSGGAGLGKTSLAKAICREIGADMMYINASKDNSIDIVRNKITQFASTFSFEGNLKVVLLDEADRLSAAAQDSLKATIEEYSKNTRFIFTSNAKNKIVEAIHSRCIIFEFTPTSEEQKDLIAQALKRVVGIIKAEGLEFDLKSVVSLVQRYYPDLRKTLNEIQRYAITGKIDAGILVQQHTTIEELVDFLKAKKFNDVRTWVARNPDLDHQGLLRYFFDHLTELFVPKTIPNIILILAQYQHYATTVADQEINTMACLVEIVSAAEWK